MPVSFSRLRISGFKSFAEPVAVDILPGLTGVIGPNGCGKSNVGEALRWVMGESSAHSLRGDEMDDVIFAGTTHRPSRNLAEVTLLLTETEGVLPPPYAEAAEIEVSRRIERGGASLYRINGREARARDVQTLFADLASGARSSGLVSQGRIAQLVNAKPEERRILLEEAAGITGLHARRHEAELKLRAAEANLARAEDAKSQLQTQFEALRRQVRQANRYRNISGLIRDAEAELLSIRRAEVEGVRAASAALLQEARTGAETATATAASATGAAAASAGLLPERRQREGEVRATLERSRLAGEQIGAELARSREQLQQATAHLAQVEQDLAHAREAEADATAALARLEAEAGLLAQAASAEPEQLRFAGERAAAAVEAAAAAEAAAERATVRAAELSARFEAATAAGAAAAARVRRLAERGAHLAAEQRQLQAERVDPAALAGAEEGFRQAGAALTEARAVLERVEHERVAVLKRTSAESAEARRQADGMREAASVHARTLRAGKRAEAEERRRTAPAAAAAQRESARAEAAARGSAARGAVAEAHSAAAAAATTEARLAAEVRTLEGMLEQGREARWSRLVDRLHVPPGLEVALGAALGEALEAATESKAPRHWRLLPPLAAHAPLPAEATPLASLLRAPEELARALAHVGLTDDGAAAQHELAPGQVLVSRAGAVWRWDGYVSASGQASAAAIRLQQRNRLAELRTLLEAAKAAASVARAAEVEVEAAEKRLRAEAEAAERAALQAAHEVERQAEAAAEALEQQARAQAESLEKEAREQAWQCEQQARAAAEAAEQAARAMEQAAREAARAAEKRLEEARGRAQALAAKAARVEMRAQALVAEMETVAGEMAEANAAVESAGAELAGLADPAEARRAMEEARVALAKARAEAQAAAGECDSLAAAAAQRAERARVVATERAGWTARAAEASRRVDELAARQGEAAATRATLAAAPERILARQWQAAEALAEAEVGYRAAADALAEAENAAATAAVAARQAEAAAAVARERALRLEGEAAAAEQAAAELELRIRERLGATAVLPDPPAESTPEVEEKLRRKHERLLRERDEMGPVNLRAEIEAEDIGQQIAVIESEGAELTSAIAKLRGSIGHLNRQGRERLLAVLEAVDSHFRALFSRMFDGGKAHLALVGDDDPLAAGLEIYAEPPGKRLATLSLLSGGEQALTAISLIFAVFRCNPAPIALLDEVDAPLDDANVERFCVLLEDMVRDCGTRFLVMTHHYITMARMDRLYGVTMQERGVSQVLSVDLRQAAEMAEA